MTTLLNRSYISPTSYPEAVKLLEDRVSGLPDTLSLEIRTLKKVGGGRKQFCRLFGLRQDGNETALPGYLDGPENVCHGVAPRYEHRQPGSNTDRGDVVVLATTRWLHEISRPPPFSWMLETSLVQRYGDVTADPSPQLRTEPDGDKNRGDSRERTPGCISTPAQPSTQIPCTLTQGSGAGVSYSTERNASAATGGGGCYGQT